MGDNRFRLVVLGSSRVGKTSIINRFLHNTFTEKYKETVDDMHHQTFRIQGEELNLEIHDTNFNFPDMRKVAIHSAHAILIVFSTDDVRTFKEMSDLWREVSEHRANIAYTPVVIVGNKSDVEIKKIYESTALAFTSHLPIFVRYMEVSAKLNEGIKEIFTTLLDLSGFMKRKKELELSAEVVDLSPPKSPFFLLPQEHFRRNRSLRAKSASRREKDEESKPRRSKSLMRKTKHMSFKSRRTQEPADEDGDCKVQ